MYCNCICKYMISEWSASIAMKENLKKSWKNNTDTATSDKSSIANTVMVISEWKYTSGVLPKILVGCERAELNSPKISCQRC